MNSIFNKDFYPTPESVIFQMLNGVDVEGKTALEPSAGKGDIVRELTAQGAKQVLTCETVEDFQAILKTKSEFLKPDFLNVTREDISHVQIIVMNPPFSQDVKHILHAWSIAPEGCQISALCNSESLKNTYAGNRRELKEIINSFGASQELGECFSNAERKTNVSVSLIKLQKPASDYKTEFNGFFMGEDKEDRETEGILPYNAIRDLVNRYIEAVKLFDKQIEIGIQMNTITSGFFGGKHAFTCTEGDKVVTRSTFKKELQKSGWKFIFDKLNLNKHATQGLRADINKFIEQQENIPFTMKNIYAMLDTVIETTGQRMEKALVEVFDKLTQHYDENRYHVEGWKTNSHYLINEKFILPYMVELGWRGEVSTMYNGNFEYVEDMLKALCRLQGDNYDNFRSLYNTISYPYFLEQGGKPIDSFRTHDEAQRKKSILEMQNEYGMTIEKHPVEWGQWFDWGYFECRAYKKGTMHFKFKTADLWGKFNQAVAKAKGYPLYESRPTTAKPKTERTTTHTPTGKAEQTILFEINI